MKKEFISNAGHEGMLIDCGAYEVEIFKSIVDSNLGNCIKYTNKSNKNTNITPFAFFIDWDKDEDGGKISLKHRDRWGSEMIFIHYQPSDLKGMFDFIAKGYNFYDELIKI